MKPTVLYWWMCARVKVGFASVGVSSRCEPILRFLSFIVLKDNFYLNFYRKKNNAEHCFPSLRCFESNSNSFRLRFPGCTKVHLIFIIWFWFFRRQRVFQLFFIRHILFSLIFVFQCKAWSISFFFLLRVYFLQCVFV